MCVFYPVFITVIFAFRLTLRALKMSGRKNVSNLFRMFIVWGYNGLSSVLIRLLTRKVDMSYQRNISKTLSKERSI